ncbi:MAG TPA: MmcQ/YjbR family DNA-binding protein [Candidatus Saccharimonadales bacterium]|nr:MmcQ/YjbR family DNA-binding protein [Candidatus Saccharimonadales bacterium]
MKHKKVEKFILSLQGAKLEYPFGEDVAVYKAKDKMFALIAEKSDPLRISLKCDPKLSEVLRTKYESVMPGYHLNKKHWNTIILSGQLPWEDIQALIRHSYLLVTEVKSDTPAID